MTRRSAGGKNLNENLNFKDPHEYLQRKLVIVGDGGTGKSSLVMLVPLFSMAFE
jgi:ABC-type transport system involved in cytochrome bd biosynthesis fused ATPase/permease subunit